MKNAIMLFCLCMLSVVAWAQDDYKRFMKVTSTDGIESIMKLTDGVTLKFSEKELTVSDKNRTLNLLLEKVKITFLNKEEATAIDYIGLANKPEIGNGEIRFFNIKKGTIVRIFKANGVMIRQLTAIDNDCLIINMNDLPSGISIISTGDYQMKVAK